MGNESACGLYQWIIKRDLGESDLAHELNDMERKGIEVFQVLSTPRGSGCRFMIVGRRLGTATATG